MPTAPPSAAPVRAVRLAVLVLAATVTATAIGATDTVRAYPARLARCADGDSGTLDVQGRRRPFRLHQIDAPELSQPHGQRSRELLCALAGERRLRAVEVTEDAYGRAVVGLAAAGLDINAELVRRGAAWVYRRYAKDPALLRLEEEARAARRGLWALPAAERMPPWEWRQKHPRRRAARATTAACGETRRCAEFATCAQAYRQLRTCGARHLDGDGDGIPCEPRCRPDG